MEEDDRKDRLIQRLLAENRALKLNQRDGIRHKKGALVALYHEGGYTGHLQRSQTFPSIQQAREFLTRGRKRACNATAAGKCRCFEEPPQPLRRSGCHLRCRQPDEERGSMSDGGSNVLEQSEPFTDPGASGSAELSSPVPAGRLFTFPVTHTPTERQEAVTSNTLRHTECTYPDYPSLTTSSEEQVEEETNKEKDEETSTGLRPTESTNAHDLFVTSFSEEQGERDSACTGRGDDSMDLDDDHHGCLDDHQNDDTHKSRHFNDDEPDLVF